MDAKVQHEDSLGIGGSSLRIPWLEPIRAIAAILALSWAAGGCEFPELPPPRNDIIVENRVAIPMRDGIALFADVYRPAGSGKHPVIVSRTPYST